MWLSLKVNYNLLGAAPLLICGDIGKPCLARRLLFICKMETDDNHACRLSFLTSAIGLWHVLFLQPGIGSPHFPYHTVSYTCLRTLVYSYKLSFDTHYCSCVMASSAHKDWNLPWGKGVLSASHYSPGPMPCALQEAGTQIFMLNYWVSFKGLSRGSKDLMYVKELCETLSLLFLFFFLAPNKRELW